jgi:hypothetical protein
MITPGEMLRELRNGHDRRAFAELTGWSYEMLRNLESGRTRFTPRHLEELTYAKWLAHTDHLYCDFMEAIMHAWKTRVFQQEDIIVTRSNETITITRDELRRIVKEAMDQEFEYIWKKLVTDRQMYHDVHGIVNRMRLSILSRGLGR